ncbi:putative integral membrane protein (apicoplast) [Babesia bovis T2Bo]|uniref:Uncharacterized protein n=1 Tax=Babesia bovis TaxID=5865 RepID=A7AXF8_BABBO|nr:putative integral membrane protein [Babesia bovis T2Bo]YP_010510668.1 putative integral membrane protein [Babesia bovis T2Bo]EDO05081.1 putative integral membrane protein [Babesia bovis T2Bo]EDO05082.1 putative integral membrane protein [Babesia bovis T2Bo]|eukprot:YP_002290861.1 hypothetical protein BBOV_V000310 (apicoplast) [Babesia bovis T2Bo]
MLYNSNNAEKVKKILTPLALKAKYIIDIIVDAILYVLEQIKAKLEQHLIQKKTPYKTYILRKLYAVLFALVNVTVTCLYLPFHIMPKKYIACFFSVINSLINMKLIENPSKIKINKTVKRVIIDNSFLN